MDGWTTWSDVSSATDQVVPVESAQLSPVAFVRPIDMPVSREQATISPQAYVRALDIPVPAETARLTPAAFLRPMDVPVAKEAATISPVAFMLPLDKPITRESATISPWAMLPATDSLIPREQATVSPRAYLAGRDLGISSFDIARLATLYTDIRSALSLVLGPKDAALLSPVALLQGRTMPNDTSAARMALVAYLSATDKPVGRSAAVLSPWAYLAGSDRALLERALAYIDLFGVFPTGKPLYMPVAPKRTFKVPAMTTTYKPASLKRTYQPVVNRTFELPALKRTYQPPALKRTYVMQAKENTPVGYKQRQSAKHLAGARNYYVDATGMLEAGVTISSATVVPSPASLTVSNVTVQSPANKVVKAKVSGGVDGTTYTLTWTFTLSDGNTEVALTELAVNTTGED
jgi:hypothetical protein